MDEKACVQGGAATRMKYSAHQEFGLQNYFMAKQGKALTYTQIHKRACRGEYGAAIHNELLRGFGYLFPPGTDR